MKLINVHGIFYKYNTKKKVKLTWLKVTEVIITVLLVIAFAGFLYENITSNIDKERFRVKGRMVDVGGYRLFTRSSGDGKATIVLESDIGDPPLQWSKLVDQLSKDNRVITYDRAGYGWSDGGSSSEGIEQSVKELKMMLRRSSARTPYILVGHGYGGLIIMRYAKEFPDDVGGIILIDTPSESYMATQEFKKDLNNRLRQAKVFRYSSYLGVVRILDKFNYIPENKKIMENLSEEGRILFKAHRVTIKHSKALYSELKGYKQKLNSVQAPELFGDKSLYVYTTISDELSTDEQKRWIESQKELLQLSTRSEHIILEDISTYVHIDAGTVIQNSINAILKRIVK